MKKILCLVLVLLTLFSVAACSDKGFDYLNEDLTQFVTLAPYAAEKLKADCAKLDALITDADVDEEINDSLKAALAFYKKITEESDILRGDMIGLSYKGVLVSTLETAKYGKDGLTTDGKPLTADQIKALTAISGANQTTAVDYVVGKGKYASNTGVYTTLYEGLLDEGLLTAKVGAKNTPIKVTFPEKYKDSALAGKEAIFFVSVDYKWQTEDARELEGGDLIVVTYVGKLTEEFAQYKDLFVEEYGELSETAVTEVIVLANPQGNAPDSFHTLIITAFNKLEDAVADRFGKEFTAKDQYKLEIEGEDEEADAPTVDEVIVEVEYTITVERLANVRCFTAQDVVDKIEEGETGKLLYKNEKKEDGTSTTTVKAFADYVNADLNTYPTYAEYVAGLKEDLQDQRTLQIAANEYQAAFKALVAASTVVDFKDNETLSELKQKYIDEVYGNIDYLARSVEASGYASLYCQMAGVATVEEYAMSVYGYTKTNIAKQLPIDAEEYVTERMVFWQFVKTYEGGMSISDAEYEAGVKNYGELLGDEKFVETYGYTEESIREALLWDKVCKTLIDKGYVEFNYVTPVED